jgi:hypothetical protein
MTRWNCLAPDAATEVATPPDRGGRDFAADQPGSDQVAGVGPVGVGTRRTAGLPTHRPSGIRCRAGSPWRSEGTGLRRLLR